MRFRRLLAELLCLGVMTKLNNNEGVTIEVALLGAGLGGGCDHTSELKVMNCNVASDNAEEWKQEVENKKEGSTSSRPSFPFQDRRCQLE